MKPDFEKGNGLLPTVVQDAETKDVLMVAWMNEESFHKTLETRENRGFGLGLVKSYGIRVALAVMCSTW